MTPEYLRLMAEIKKEEAQEREKNPFFAVMFDIYNLEKEYERKLKRLGIIKIELGDGRLVTYEEVQKMIRQSIGRSVTVARAHLKFLEKNLDNLNKTSTYNP